ncbi:MAG: chromosomal replication initiator protein DnaA [Nitrospinota bacterium]
MQALWTKCLARIQEEVSPQAYERWFSGTRLAGREGDTFTIEVPDPFSLDTLRARYSGLLESILRQEAGGAGLSLRWAAAPNGHLLPAARPAPAPVAPPPKPEFLNSKYTFGTFVVGASNEFARACALRVADGPGQSLNPLFLYGGVGLGKTHLLHAIAHRVLEARPGARVYYTSSENFINELISSLQHNRMAEFRSKYRKIDAFLVDDVQFIAGKERTQEEFFFTFNALYEAGKQIVMTSDKTPTDTPGLEDRLRTRFVWGMTADIGAPDFETKVAILQKKAADQNFALPAEVAHFIAEKARSNVRELEGCLIKVIFHASLHGADIDVPMAQEVLKGLVRESSRAASIDAIQRVVADHFQIRVVDMKSKNRSQAFALPRQIAMYLARELTRASTTEIGRRFGGKDHSTVIHSTNKIRELLRKDPEFAASVQRLQEKVDASA